MSNPKTSTTNNNKPIFLVFGSTGQQGCGIVKALSKSNKWRIRCLTRDPSSEKTQCLKDLNGVELMKCDCTSNEDLRRAMKGVNTVFLVTDYWNPSQRGRELEIGKMIVDIAKEAGVKHFIYSGLPNAELISKGKRNVPFFTDKAKVSEYAFKTIPTTVVMAAHYYQNFGTFVKPERQHDGTLLYSVPKVLNLPGIDVNDLGEAVCNIACNCDTYIGKTIPLFGDSLSLEGYLNTMKEVTGQKIKINLISFEEYEKIGGRDLTEMYRFCNEFEYYGPNCDSSLGRKLCPNLKTMRQYLETTNPK